MLTLFVTQLYWSNIWTKWNDWWVQMNEWHLCHLISASHKAWHPLISAPCPRCTVRHYITCVCNDDLHPMVRLLNSTRMEYRYYQCLSLQVSHSIVSRLEASGYLCAPHPIVSTPDLACQQCPIHQARVPIRSAIPSPPGPCTDGRELALC